MLTIHHLKSRKKELKKKLFLLETVRPWTAGGAAGADGAGAQQPVGQARSRGKGSYAFKCVSLRDSKHNCSHF